MVIKQKFELIYKSSGEMHNIVPVSASTLAAYKTDKDDVSHLNGLVKTFSRIKQHPASNIVDKEMKSLTVVDFPLYSLPGFITTRGLAVVNLAPFPYKLVTDYSPQDMFTIYMYVLVLKKYYTKKPFRDDNIISITNMFFSIFMKLFGKKSGLIGSYKHLIPKLRFLIQLYISVAFFGVRQDDKIYKKIASQLMMDYDDLNLDYNFSSIKEFLKAINENNIIAVSGHTFSTEIINRFGIAALPMFEDVSRFYATLLASTIPGNSLFSGVLKKINTQLFEKLVYTAMEAGKK